MLMACEYASGNNESGGVYIVKSVCFPPHAEKGYIELSARPTLALCAFLPSLFWGGYVKNNMKS